MGAAGDREVVVTWSPPESPGSSDITGYRIRQLPDGPTREVPADVHTFTASGLTNGESYAFVVTAINSSGPGNTSEPAEATRRSW